jgi:site-specific DNA recombinase
MGEVRAAAVYARISSDQDGTALGVKRQVEDCRRTAEQLGWTVAEEYVDNDVSAYSGKRRPAYERMLTDIAEGLRDAVIVYHADRLTRRPLELEQFLEVITTAQVRHVRFASGGDIDIANGDGLLVLRMLAAVAANESAAKSRRVRRKMVEVAEAGRPHGGSNRPFGYQADMTTVNQEEADVIRSVAERFIAGESLGSLCRWLEDTGVKTPANGRWRTSTLRNVLANGRIAGLREHNGEVVATAVWDPIITLEQRERILQVIESRRTSNRRTPRSYLLSGMLRCHRCNHRLYAAARNNSRRYVCSSSHDHGGCGGTMITALPVEELITNAVLYRLDTPELAETLKGQARRNTATAEMADELAADREQLDELAALYAAKRITSREWLTARSPIEERISVNERRIAQQSEHQAAASHAGHGEELRRRWEQLSLTQRHAIIKSVLDHAVIHAGTPGARQLDPNRVEPIWRV